MQKIAGGRGIGASSVTSAKAWAGAVGGGAVTAGEAIEDGAGGEGDDLVAADFAGLRRLRAVSEKGRELHWGRDPIETRRMTGFRTGAVLSMIVGDGCQRDPGGSRRDHGHLPLVRRRDALRARPARALQARLRGLHGAPGPRAVHPPDRRRPRRRGLRAALQPGAPARRRLLLAHVRGPRSAPVRGHRRRRRLQPPGDAAARARALVRGRAARALRRDPGRLARRAVAPPQRLQRR